jgi:uncharacterized membrane protein YkoI
MRLITTLSLVAAIAVAAGSLAAQEAPGMKRNVPDSLVAKAKVREDSAQAIALKRVPGEVESVVLGKMRTRLVYTFEIKRSGRQDLTKVEVNAATGHIIAVARERTRAKPAAHRSS